MILLVLLICVSLFIYQSNRKETGYYPLLTITLPFILYVFFLVEVGISSLNYFVSDEIEYWDGPQNHLSLGTFDRLLWYFLNYFLKNIDIGGIVAVKLISIPILFFTLYILWKIYFKDKRIFLLVLVLPYFMIISIKSLRDIAILFFAVSTFYIYYKVKFGKILFLIPIILLFISRPFIGFICLFIIPFDTFFSKYITASLIRFKLTVKKKIVFYTVAIILGILLIRSLPYIDNRLSKYLYYFSYNTSGKGYYNRLAERGGISTGHASTDYIVGAVRFIFTPIPTSIMYRSIKGGSKDWGLVDDIIRTFNQSFYYFLLLYVFFNIKAIYLKLRYLDPCARQLLYVLLLYLPIYTFYGFGVAHQRIKLVFQLAVFLLFIINKNINRVNGEKVSTTP